jgi:hypothetical protein
MDTMKTPKIVHQTIVCPRSVRITTAPRLIQVIERPRKKFGYSSFG